MVVRPTSVYVCVWGGGVGLYGCSSFNLRHFIYKGVDLKLAIESAKPIKHKKIITFNQVMYNERVFEIVLCTCKCSSK